MTHEPTPYSIRDDVRIYSGNVQVAICVGPFNVGGEFQHEDALGMDKKANADFIVRSCNAHDALLDALKNLVSRNVHDVIPSMEMEPVFAGVEELPQRIWGRGIKEAISAIRFAQGGK